MQQRYKNFSFDVFLPLMRWPINDLVININLLYDYAMLNKQWASSDLKTQNATFEMQLCWIA